MTTAKKNNYGGGSITQIQKGKYRIRYSVDGEVTSITISGSKRDAEEGLKRLKAESKKGIIKVKKEGKSGSADPTFAELADIFMESRDFSGSGNTLKLYTTIIRHHLVPDLGKEPVSKLTYHKLISYAHGLREKNRVRYWDTTLNMPFYDSSATLSNATRQKIVLILKVILKYGIKTQGISPMPWLSEIKIANRDDNENKPSEYALSAQEVEALLELSKGTRYEPIILLAVNTGAHISELMGLTWNDCDFESDKPSVRFHRTLYQGSDNGEKVTRYQGMKRSWRKRRVGIPLHVARFFNTYKKTVALKMPTIEAMKGKTTFTYTKFGDMPLFVNSTMDAVMPNTDHLKGGAKWNPRWKAITAKQLEYLIWNKTKKDVGEMFGISGQTVTNKCNKLGLNQPPANYFSRMNPHITLHEIASEMGIGEPYLRALIKGRARAGKTRTEFHMARYREILRRHKTPAPIGEVREVPEVSQTTPRLSGRERVIGDPWFMQGISKAVKKLIRQVRTPDEFGEMVGLPEQANFKSLRHTHATLLLHAGVAVEVVSHRLGHKDINTTISNYLQHREQQDQEAVAVMDGLSLGNSSEEPKVKLLPKAV